MRKTLKRVGLAMLVLLGLIIIIPLAYLGVTLTRASGGLPVWNASIEVPGLTGEVEILRDENGVPHVYAANERDAYFGQGFAHAQDRLWQMLATRQALSGRLSEWLGAVTLRSDRLHRALRISKTAQRDFNFLSEEDRSFLTAYSDGVNAYLRSALYRRPPEMLILHITPEAWRPHDSITIIRGVYLTLVNSGLELNAQRLAIHGTHPRAVELFDALPFEFLPIIDAGMQASAMIAPIKENSYSDSWVVTGDFSASGRPLLANDPQLPSTLPSFWYLMHLSIGGTNRVGATLPGMPAIAAGRTDRIAWGVTNGMVDQMDMMLLRGQEQDPDLYRRLETDAWERFDTSEETYTVRFGDPYRETLRFTTLGTVIPEDLLTSPVTKDQNAYVEARIPFLDGDTSMAALIHLNRARDVSAAIDALASFTGPSLNFTLADVDGGIAYVSAGRYASREGEAATIIDYAPRDSSEWATISYDENPKSLTPLSGRFVSANQQVIGEQYPYYLSDFWAAPFRAVRIHELLDSSPRHDVNTFLEMQRDLLSVPARRIVPEMLDKVSRPGTETEAAMLQVLENWDYRFTPEAAGSTVFLTWLHTFYEQLARDEIGEALWPQLGGEPLPPIVFHVLEGRNQDWCATVGVEEPTACADILNQSLAIAAGRLKAELGPAPGDWRWDHATAIEHPHQIFAGLPILGSMFSRTFNYPGGPDTLMIQYVDASSAPRFTRANFCSSYQAIYDLADLENSQFMLSTGQSGHFRSPYYDNFLARFAAGERFTIPTDLTTIDAAGRLELKPAK